MRFPSVVIVLSVVLAVPSARSGVLRNYPQTLVQPDGSVVSCFASGDEYHHRLHDGKNFTIVQDPGTGCFVYALLEHGALSPTPYLVGTVDPEAAGLPPGADVPFAGDGLRKGGSLGKSAVSAMVAGTVGTLNNIVIFIHFSDEPSFVFTDGIADYDAMFNSALPGANSLYNYYREASYNQLGISSTFYPASTDRVVSYGDSHPRNYYRKYNVVTNPAGYASGDEASTREQSMLAGAVRAVSPQIPADVNIDANNDGYVDNICFVVSGGAEGWADLLWPHMTSLTIEQVPINGKVVGVYNFQLRNTLMDPGNKVYVLAHEMFHSLGAPDLYHYTTQPVDPVGSWDLMDYSGNPPVHMSAYMKAKYGGWINAIPAITAPGTYTLAPLVTSAGNCYKVPSLYSAKEFYVLEYRRRAGTFERSLPGEGLLVYRVNADYGGNANGPPDELYLYRPGGTTGANGDLNGAAMSANAGRVAMNDSTSPSGFLSNGSPGGLVITGVGFLGDTLSFTIDFPRVPVIQLSTRAIYFEPIGDLPAAYDTSFIVRNAGYGPDSLTTSLSHGATIPDSAITVFPGAFALAPRDSQTVTIRMRPGLLSSGYYSALVLVTSKFGTGQKTFSTVMDFERVTTGVAGSPGLAGDFFLGQNYPNPFNPTTTIQYSVGGGVAPGGASPGGVEGRSRVRLAIFDLLGREVATLVDQAKDPGTYSVVWNASGCPSGVYYCRMAAGGYNRTRALVVVR